MRSKTLILLALILFSFSLAGCDDSDELPIDVSQYLGPNVPGGACDTTADNPCCGADGKVKVNGLKCEAEGYAEGVCQDGVCQAERCTCNTEDGCCDGCMPINNGGSCGEGTDDGFACTNEVCMAGECTHPIVPGTCLIDEQCYNEGEIATDNSCLVCAPARYTTAWTGLPNGTACSDGEWCNVGETCMAGACQGGSARNCDGVVTDGQCQEAACDEDNDMCVANAINEDVACHDGLFCTINDVCQGGVCSGAARDCSGLVAEPQCEVAFCDEDADRCFVNNINQDQPCDDGLFCTVGDVCDLGVCYAPKMNDCLDVITNFDCQEPVCVEDADQCVANNSARNGWNCNDGNLCTGDSYGNDKCHDGTCAGLPKDCSYVLSGLNGQCNEATCDPLTGACEAVTANDGLACDDNNFCTLDTVCGNGMCEGGTARSCDDFVDDPACSFAYCDPTICVNCSSLGGHMGDCVVEDRASGTLCADDGIACTDDECDGDGICNHLINSGFCLIDGQCILDGVDDPNNECMTCNASADNTRYTPKSSSSDCTDDGVDCTTDLCNGEGVCVHDIATGNCLIDGTCYASGDLNPANDCEECDPTAGRDFPETTWTPIDGGHHAKNDYATLIGCDGWEPESGGFAADETCTFSYCVEGVCTTNTTVREEEDCDDKDRNDCTTGICLGGSCAPQNLVNGTECDDGLFCTEDYVAATQDNDSDPDTDDVCTDGVCGGAPKNCHELGGDGCTIDTCNELLDECFHSPVDCALPTDTLCNYTVCEDRTIADFAAMPFPPYVASGFEAYECVPKSKIDHIRETNNAYGECHTYTCDDATGQVTATPIDVATACDDGNLCTDDYCDDEAGCVNVPVECEVLDACETGECNPATGDCDYAWAGTDEIDGPCYCETDADCNTGLDPDSGNDYALMTCRASTCEDKVDGVTGARLGTYCDYPTLTDDTAGDPGNATQNDIRTDAIFTPAGSTDYTSIEGDDDWFKIDACQGSTITATLTGDVGNLDLALFFGAVQVAQSDNADANESISYTVPNGDNGMYYLHVMNPTINAAANPPDPAESKRNNINECYPYALTLTANVAACTGTAAEYGGADCNNQLDDDSDGNSDCKDDYCDDLAEGGTGVGVNGDVYTSAITLPGDEIGNGGFNGQFVSGKVGGIADEDWYEFEVCNGGTLTLQAIFTDAGTKGDIDMYVHKLADTDGAANGCDGPILVTDLSPTATGPNSACTGTAVNAQGISDNSNETLQGVQSVGAAPACAPVLGGSWHVGDYSGFQDDDVASGECQTDTLQRTWFVQVLTDITDVAIDSCTPYTLNIGFDFGDDGHDYDTVFDAQQASGNYVNATTTPGSMLPFGTRVYDFVLWGGDTTDFYTVDIPCPAGTLTVDLAEQDDNGTNDLDMALMNANGTWNAGSSVTDGAAAENRSWVAPQTGVLRVMFDGAADFCDKVVYNLKATFNDAACAENACGASSQTACCTDGSDNDFDGLTDCADPDCAALDACKENLCALGDEFACCSDGVDNNVSGGLDWCDPSCDDSFDNNDTAAAANDLDWTQTFAGNDEVVTNLREYDSSMAQWTFEAQNLDARDNDWYRFPSCFGAMFDIDLTFLNADANLDAYLVLYKDVDGNPGPDVAIFESSVSTTDNEGWADYLSTVDGWVYLWVDHSNATNTECALYDLSIVADYFGCDNNVNQETCNNGTDDDGDGLLKCEDPDCFNDGVNCP